MITIPVLNIFIISFLVSLILRVVEKLIEGESVSLYNLMDWVLIVIDEVSEWLWMLTEFTVDGVLVLNITKCSNLVSAVVTTLLRLLVG